MKNDNQDVIDIIKKFEIVNKEVIRMSRRLSGMKLEVAMLKQKIKTAGGV